MRHAYGAMVAINLPWLQRPPPRRAARGGADRCWPTGTRSSRRATPSVTSCATPPRASIRPASRSDHRPGAARPGEAEPRGDAGRVRRRPGRRGRPARRASLVPAGADRARARARGAGGRARPISNAPPARWPCKEGSDERPQERRRPEANRGPPPRRGPPRGVATMAIVRWVLVAIDRARRRRFDRSATPASTSAARKTRTSSARSSTPARCTRRSCRTTRASVRSAA